MQGAGYQYRSYQRVASRSNIVMLLLLALVQSALLPGALRAPRLSPPREALQTSIHRLRLYAETEEDFSENFEVVLRDTETNRTLECRVLETTEVLGRMYASMTPIDEPAAITTIEDNVMVELDDDELLEELWQTAAAATSEMGLTLMNTPVTLTIAGDFASLPPFDESTLGLSESPEDMETSFDNVDGMEESESDDGAEVLLSFCHERTTYYVVRLLEPTFIVGE
ncbi:MAG: hypothetical protein SGPRY_003756 [Prymnesium sp.]